MTRARSLLATVLALVAALAGPVPRASAADPITLQASPAVVPYGTPVALSGAISPPAAGEPVTILTPEGEPLAQATTDPAGSFSATVTPERSVTAHAVWGSASSAPVDIGVRAVVRVRLSEVRLFDSAVVRGTVDPPVPGAAVSVALSLGRRVVVERSPAMDDAGAFTVELPIREPGTYRARATFRDAGLLRGKAASDPRSTPLPSLRVGSRGKYVRALERRLVGLNYRLVAMNEVFDDRTADAVMAFTKVQRMTRRSTVDAAVWRALADPVRPSPRSRARGFHIEVDQTRQVLYTVQDGAITSILHVSTGAGGATRDGTFHVYRKLAGFSANRLYYPSYFDGLRAIHGWTEVPSYPASHGCVRVPYWNAQWIFGLADLGTTVLVYH